MYKEFYEEDREWALGRIGGRRGAGEERVGDGSFNRVGIFFPCFLVHDFSPPTFLVHGSLFSQIEPFTTINSASHLFNFQPQTRPSSSERPPEQIIKLDKTSTTVNQIRPRSDSHILVQHQTILRPKKQIRPLEQTVTTIPYHQIRSSRQTTILDYSASNQHITTSLLEWYTLGAFLMGWIKGGGGGYIELWMNLAKHTFHTFSA